MSSPKRSNFIELNIAVLFLSTSGVLGRFIPLSPEMSIWWRSVLGVFLLFGYCQYKGYAFAIPSKKSLRAVLFGGVLMAGHWILYFYSLKMSSVAIAMLAVFTYPAITTFIEPLILKQPFSIRHLLLACLVMLGIYFLAPSLNVNDGVTVGLLLGVVSAAMYALRNVLMKREVAGVNGTVIMTYQLAVIIAVTTPALYFFPFLPSAEAWPYLLALAVVTTALGQTLFLLSFKNFSVSTASLLGAVNPIYGILWGVLFFQERPGWSAILGGVFILAATVVEAYAIRDQKDSARSSSVVK